MYIGVKKGGWKCREASRCVLGHLAGAEHTMCGAAVPPGLAACLGPHPHQRQPRISAGPGHLPAVPSATAPHPVGSPTLALHPLSGPLRRCKEGERAALLCQSSFVYADFGMHHDCLGQPIFVMYVVNKLSEGCLGGEQCPGCFPSRGCNLDVRKVSGLHDICSLKASGQPPLNSAARLHAGAWRAQAVYFIAPWQACRLSVFLKISEEVQHMPMHAVHGQDFKTHGD